MPSLELHAIPRNAAALLVCVCLSASTLAPSVVLAAPAEAAPADGAESGAPADGTADAETIFRRGQAKYETADYNGAIELWTEAYALVDSTPENASIKALLIFNLAQAHTKAYDLDEDPIHLKQAKSLLLSYGDNLELLYSDPEALASEQAKVDEKVAEIDAKLEQLEEAAAAEAEAEAEPPPPSVEPPSDPGPPPQSGTPLIAAGGALVGLGAAGGIVGILGAVIGAGANDISDLDPNDLGAREDQFNRGRVGNALLLVGAVAAGLLVPTGAALVAIGAKRNKGSRTADVQLSPSFAGAWGAGGGLSLSGRF